MHRSITALILLTAALWAGQTEAVKAETDAITAPQMINYQGKLTDGSGNPIQGTKSVTFEVYDAASGGTKVWEEAQTVSFANGIFNTVLGSTQPLVIPDGPDCYLQVIVDGVTISPRIRVVSAPYSLKAADADKLDGQDAAYFATTGHTHSEMVSGSGAAGYVPLWTDGSTQDTSVIQQSGQRVAVGGTASNPLVKFWVRDATTHPVLYAERATGVDRNFAGSTVDYPAYATFLYPSPNVSFGMGQTQGALSFVAKDHNPSQYGNIQFYTGNTQLGFNSAERMRINYRGNVGVGTANPDTFRLNVAGSTRTSGNLSVGGTLTVGTILTGTVSVPSGTPQYVTLSVQNTSEVPQIWVGSAYPIYNAIYSTYGDCVHSITDAGVNLYRNCLKISHHTNPATTMTYKWVAMRLR